MRDLPNKGLYGKGSIRIAGHHHSQLPIRESRIAADQFPNVDKTEKETLQDEIRAKFPKHNIAYLESRIKESELNVLRIIKTREQQDQMIRDYTGQISMCAFRDREIENIADDDDDRKEKIKDLKKKYPPYNVPAMEQQIRQCREAIQRCDQVVAREYESIAEFREVVVLCQHRDSELKRAGADV